MLNVKQVTKSYHRKTVLKDCSFELKPTQIMGIFGHNGCGKTTLFRIIAGIIHPDEGNVEVDRERVGYMPEQRSLLIDLTLEKQASFLGKLRGMDEDLIALRIQELTNTFGFVSQKDKPMKTLSKGNQQKAQLILTLMSDPKLLILDEPFNGLDYHSQVSLSKWVRSYAHQGNAVLISSHQLEHMNGLCDEILILDHGKTIKQGRLQTIREQHQLYSVKVNVDSNWKDFGPLGDLTSAGESWVEYRFSSLSQAKKSIASLLKDRSVNSVHMELVALSELINL